MTINFNLLRGVTGGWNGYYCLTDSGKIKHASQTRFTDKDLEPQAALVCAVAYFKREYPGCKIAGCWMKDGRLFNGGDYIDIDPLVLDALEATCE